MEAESYIQRWIGSVRADRVRTIGSVLLAVVTGLVVFGLAASTVRAVGPARIGVRLSPATDGVLTLVLPPFGSVSADTHAGPISATISLEEVDVAGITALANNGVPSREEIDAWVASLRWAVALAGIQGLLAAVAASAVVARALVRSRRVTAASSLIVLVLLGLGLAIGAGSFDAAAFEEPTYEGALSYAPQAISLVQGRIADVETLQGQIGALAEGLAAYYGVDQAYVGGGLLSDTYRVLHVSDLHLDPVGMQLALDLASAYDVALVIDTGDIAHFGTEQEAALAVAQMSGRPYVFVPGNHDSPSIVAAIADSGVTVLDAETTITAGGLAILGVGDPAGAGSDVEPDSARAAERGREVADDRAGQVFDIVAVHDPATGQAFAGATTIVLSGHTHAPALETRDGTVFLGAGTTGGVHFTELRSDPHIPHSAAILYFSRTEPGVLVAVDQIEVYGKTRQSAIRRTVFDEDSASGM
ncbi:MAG: metallophosphoesterase family protein [Coriobacteriia bacterium]|nr:metallophosphoesterase family protein [Coriobacteriia bacterium]